MPADCGCLLKGRVQGFKPARLKGCLVTSCTLCECVYVCMCIIYIYIYIHTHIYIYICGVRELFTEYQLVCLMLQGKLDEVQKHDALTLNRLSINGQPGIKDAREGGQELHASTHLTSVPLESAQWEIPQHADALPARKV